MLYELSSVTATEGGRKEGEQEGEDNKMASVVASVAPPGPWTCQRIGAVGFVPRGLFLCMARLLLRRPVHVF